MSDPKSKLSESVSRMKAVQAAVKAEAEKIRQEKEAQAIAKGKKP